MRSYFVFAFLLTGHCLYAQKETTTTIDAKHIEEIIIKSDEVYKVTISTAPLETVTLKTRADGEYYDNITLDAEVNGNILVLTSRYSEILQSGFDKLSAHKVFAMEVELLVPENLKIEIISNLASVYAKGNYQRLFVQLKSGFCMIREFKGDAVINTYDGNVTVETSGAMIEATSRHGRVDMVSDNYSAHTISITSINGNISVKKTN